MPDKLVALLMIFGTIALMVAWIPCVDCTTRFCLYVCRLFGRTPAPNETSSAGQQAGGVARKAA